MRTLRRIAGAVLCIAFVAIAARSSIADAILARGDDAARAGRVGDAIRYYERAVVVGGASRELVDRLALLSLLAPRGHRLGSALTIADAFLAAHPLDADARFDRGLMEWREHQYATAAADFGRVVRLDGDPRARAFASASRRRARTEADS